MRANNQTSCQCPGPAYTISASLHNASSLPWSGAHSLGFYAQCLITALVRSSHSRLLFAKDHQRQHVVSTAVNLQCHETQPDVAKRETTPKAGLACSAFLSHSESLIAIWALVVWTDFCHVGKQFSFSPWVPNYSLFLFDGDILFLRCPMCHRGEKPFTFSFIYSSAGWSNDTVLSTLGRDNRSSISRPFSDLWSLSCIYDYIHLECVWTSPTAQDTVHFNESSLSPLDILSIEVESTKCTGVKQKIQIHLICYSFHCLVLFWGV